MKPCHELAYEEAFNTSQELSVVFQVFQSYHLGFKCFLGIFSPY